MLRRNSISGLALAGALLARWSPGPAMLVFPALVVVAAVTATVSKGIRTISPR